MPAPWRPKDYGNPEFRSRRIKFTTPDRAGLSGEMQDEGKEHVDDPANLAGAVLCWLISHNVRTALRGSSVDKVAKELGISANHLAKAISGNKPFPIEYVAALVARFPEETILPTADELNKALRDMVNTPRGERRGKGYFDRSKGRHGFLTEDDIGLLPWDPPMAGGAEPTETERDAEWHLSISAGSLVTGFLGAVGDDVEVETRVRIAAGPVAPNRVIQVETQRGTEHRPFLVEASGELPPDWPETVAAEHLQVLDGHFVTRIIDPGDDPRFPRVVEALFVFPDLNSGDAMPIGRPFLATVEWRDDEDLAETVPTLTPTLDGYAEELYQEVVEDGDPYGIRYLFPR